MTTRAPKGYTMMQIALHWGVVVLVIAQMLLGPSMSAAVEARAADPAATLGLPALAHIVIGCLILGLALWRVGLRFANNTPALTFEPRTSDQEFLAFVSRELVFFLYFILFAIPVMGLVGWFYDSSVAVSSHASMKVLIFVIVGVHVFLVLFQQFGLRDGAFTRMRKPRQTD